MKITWKNIKELEAEVVAEFHCRRHKNRFKRWLCYLCHGFIPHRHNSHYPHLLRPKALISYSLALIAVKLFATAFLFIAFPNPAAFSEGLAGAMLKLTNTARAENGVSGLTEDQYLNQAAEMKINDMVAKNYFSHYTPEGYAPWYFIDNVNYNYDLAGENLGMNFTRAKSLQNAFMASPGHRDNILDARFEDIGLAAAPAEINNRPTQLMVLFFAKPHQPSLSLKSTLNFNSSTPPTAEKTTDPPPEQKIATSTSVAGAISPINKFNYPEELLVLANDTLEKTWATRLYGWSHLFFIIFLVFLSMSFIINLIVKIHVQHGQLLLQSTLVLVLAFGLFYIRLHFLENINLELSIL